MYEHGVSRVQTKWHGLKRHVYMAHPHDKNKLLEYDACTGDVREWADDQFDFSNCLVVQVDQDTLITFKKNDLTTTKYSNLRKVSESNKRASEINQPKIAKTELAKPNLSGKKDEERPR